MAGPEASRDARRRHILWVIEHHSENDITTLPEFTIDRARHLLADAEGYGQAKKVWLDQVRLRKGDVRVLLHAAAFFKLRNKALALTLLKQAIQLSPRDTDIASSLGYTLRLQVRPPRRPSPASVVEPGCGHRGRQRPVANMARSSGY